MIKQTPSVRGFFEWLGSEIKADTKKILNITLPGSDLAIGLGTSVVGGLGIALTMGSTNRHTNTLAIENAIIRDGWTLYLTNTKGDDNHYLATKGEQSIRFMLTSHRSNANTVIFALKKLGYDKKEIDAKFGSIIKF